MPIKTENWNQYLAEVVKQNHPMIKQMAAAINPQLKLFSQNNEVNKYRCYDKFKDQFYKRIQIRKPMTSVMG